MTPIFLFSLPRAGSTLLQRMLNTNHDVYTVPEDWLLLPFVMSLRKTGTVTNYGHTISTRAIKEFISLLPKKKQDYNNSLREFVLSLYTKVSPSGTRYFLAKTPRYYEIIDEIARLFPEAKLIFLMRNPIEVFASMLETWSGGTLKASHHFSRDLLHGTTKLYNGYLKHRTRSLLLSYRDIVTHPQLVAAKLEKYLGITFADLQFRNLRSIGKRGSLGDPTGQYRYKKISTEPLQKWHKTIAGSVRKHLARKYLLQIPEDVFSYSGVSKAQVLQEVQQLPNELQRLFPDLFYYLRGDLITRFNLNLLMKKEYQWTTQGVLK
ncbi:MAG: sulfotransferase [Candidatus Dojkabacteria bacterium]|nr:MAG: sulfotransferase [Candidatus Dojkabacteria bacterium]